MSGAGYGERVVEIARRWCGTPYRHQAAVEGAGCDCLGLLRGIWREIYGCEPEVVPNYSRDWAEPIGEEALWRAADRHLVRKDVGLEAVGDVLLFRMRRGAVAKHLGIQGEVGSCGSFLHAYDGHSVNESPLSQPWRDKIVARFSFPEEMR